MSSLTPKIRSKRPTSIFRKEVSADFKRLFTALTKAISHGASGKWEELGTDAADAIAALGIATDPGELLSLLVQRALTKAVFELVGESLNQSDAKDGAADILNRRDFSQHNTVFELDSRFLDRPDQIALIAPTKILLDSWLTGAGFGSAAAQAISNRLPAYFVYSLNHEWRRNANSYKPLLDAINTPFTRAGEREWSWASYAALLQRRIDESMLDEPFSLRQLYVPLNGYFLDDTKVGNKPEDIPGFPRNPKKIVVDVEQQLTDWLNRNDPHDAIRVLSGGPGSGKSSFAKIFAANIARQSLRKVVFIPLHLIDPDRSLDDEVGRFVKDEGVLQQNPLDQSSPESHLLIIFDGLDELASLGKAAAETTRAFVSEIERTVQRRNSGGTQLQVLISGRELVVQENQSEFRHHGQVITILPYFVGANESRNEENYHDPNSLLHHDLRHKWWGNYGALTGRPILKLPSELKRRDLDDVTAQPLLNYLVALSYTRGKLNFDGDINLNIVYSDLVAAVYERGYERRRAHTSIRHMPFEDFLRVLEEVALAAWHGDGRTTTIREIEQHCELSGVGSLLERFKEGAEAGVTRLLAAFFFRQHGRRPSGDPTFVFTHKSFGEYLAALRVVRAVNRINREMLRRIESHDEGWDERESAKHWAQISGPSAISPYLFVFLRAEIKLREVSVIATIQANFARLFSNVLKNGLPIEALSTSSFRVAMFRARNSEEAMLALLNACARVTNTISTIDHPDRTSFGAWLRRIQGQRTSPASNLVMDCLSLLNLREVSFDIADLFGANLRGSDLTDATAHGVCAIRANFVDTKLTRTIFQFSNLTDCHFDNAHLENTDFAEANLTRASFAGARFSGLKLIRAQLRAIEPPEVRTEFRDLAKQQTDELRRRQSPSETSTPLRPQLMASKLPRK